MSVFQASYDRICNLKVYNTTTIPGIAATGGKTLKQVDFFGKEFPSKQSDGSPGFRIKFQVQKIQGPVPAPHDIVVTIWNLGEDSRTLVSGLNNLLVLEAGYGTQAETLFKGNISYAVTRKENSDYVTEIHAGSGLYAFQNSLINKSFETPTPAAQVIQTLLGVLKQSGIDQAPSTAIPQSNYNKGVVLSGKVVDELQNVCQKNNLDWCIEDDKVVIVPFNGFKPSIPIFISPDTGLIGIPEQRAIDLNNQKLISFKVLLNPKIGIFQQVFISSKFVTGSYTTTKVTHTGDTFGTDFYTECEAH